MCHLVVALGLQLRALMIIQYFTILIILLSVRHYQKQCKEVALVWICCYSVGLEDKM